MTNSLFLEKSIDEIHKLLKNRKLSIADIGKVTTERIKKSGEKYHAFTEYSEDTIQGKYNIQQKLFEQYGIVKPFTAIPIAIKDIFNTIDYKTQMGSPLWKDFMPGNDARVVYYLKNADGIIVGKTVTAEFAVHALNETLNPYDISKTPGTSSSGSAVAVALGIVPIALGTQTAGSIIRPASFCGVYGFKPSYGLIPRTGILKTTDTLDTVGFFTTMVDNIKRIFDIVIVKGPNFPFSNSGLKASAQKIHNSQKQKVKIAFVKTYTWDDAYNYAQNSILKFINKIANCDLFDICETELPSVVQESHKIHEIIYDKCLSYYFVNEYKQKQLISEMMNKMLEHGLSISTQEYISAIRKQEEIICAMDKFFEHYDIILSLSTAGEAPNRNVCENRDPCLIWTLSHLPAINIPIFYSPNGLPFGIQAVAKKYDDYMLINFCENLVKIIKQNG
ncbi:MAG: amidase [Holosporales bacterium]|jgi:Asp-tRNA(Asn)/Glu-tRNA(Gln) amidotransferase A subunit family amidase|nr:amidase [Holosporales bacterium]